MSQPPLIEISDLRVTFHGDDGRTTHAVDAVDLTVPTGATTGPITVTTPGGTVTTHTSFTVQ